jgi:hypothetical protein
MLNAEPFLKMTARFAHLPDAMAIELRLSACARLCPVKTVNERSTMRG